MDELNALRAACAGCTGCGLAATRHSVVFGVGPCPSPVVFIGEGPGQQEDLRGEPFVGPAGQLLDDMLSIIDLGGTAISAISSNAARPETATRSRRSRTPASGGSSGSSGCCSRASSSASGALRPCGLSGRISASRGGDRGDHAENDEKRLQDICCTHEASTFQTRGLRNDSVSETRCGCEREQRPTERMEHDPPRPLVDAFITHEEECDGTRAGARTDDRADIVDDDVTLERREAAPR